MSDSRSFSQSPTNASRANYFAPCSQCAFCVPCENGQGDYCLYYNGDLPDGLAEDRYNELRKQCRGDGNHFAWPVRDIKPLELVRWKVEVEKTNLPRRILLLSAVMSFAGLILSVLGYLNSLHATHLPH